MKTLLICSGGLDSVSLAYRLLNQQQLALILSFDYGQRHKKELSYAKLCAKNCKVPHKIVDISAFGKLLSSSALTSDISIPDGHYAEDNMKLTVVPNRNAIMITMAYAIAATYQLDAVALAVHGGDHFIYPDCRPEFISAIGHMQNIAMDSYANIELLAPYVNQSKADIVKDGAQNNADFINSWSCYKGEEIHCGSCGTCVERQEAFYLAQVPDPTEYQDPTYWKTVTKIKF